MFCRKLNFRSDQNIQIKRHASCDFHEQKVKFCIFLMNNAFINPFKLIQKLFLSLL